MEHLLHCDKVALLSPTMEQIPVKSTLTRFPLALPGMACICRPFLTVAARRLRLPLDELG